MFGQELQKGASGTWDDHSGCGRQVLWLKEFNVDIAWSRLVVSVDMRHE